MVAFAFAIMLLFLPVGLDVASRFTIRGVTLPPAVPFAFLLVGALVRALQSGNPQYLREAYLVGACTVITEGTLWYLRLPPDFPLSASPYRNGFYLGLFCRLYALVLIGQAAFSAWRSVRRAERYLISGATWFNVVALLSLLYLFQPSARTPRLEQEAAQRAISDSGTAFSHYRAVVREFDQSFVHGKYMRIRASVLVYDPESRDAFEREVTWTAPWN